MTEKFINTETIKEINGESKKDKGFGLGVSKEDAETLKHTLGNINDLIDHDQSVTATDLSNLESALKNIKIDVGGGKYMTQAEIEKDEETIKNMKIWKEMSEGNFENIWLLTRITKEVSKYLVNIKGDINLYNLTTAIGLILPQTVGGYLDLEDLTTIEGLILPQTVRGDIYFRSLPPSEIEKLKEQRPDLADKIK